jgi:propionate CoA-transferase
VFRLGADGLTLIEIGPGVDVERHVLAQMGFRPKIAPDLKTMDAALFKPEPIGLGARIAQAPRHPRSTRVAEWQKQRGLS